MCYLQMSCAYTHGAKIAKIANQVKLATTIRDQAARRIPHHPYSGPDPGYTGDVIPVYGQRHSQTSCQIVNGFSIHYD